MSTDPLRQCLGCRHLSAGPFPSRECARGHYVDGGFNRRDEFNGQWDMDKPIDCGDRQVDAEAARG